VGVGGGEARGLNWRGGNKMGGGVTLQHRRGWWGVGGQCGFVTLPPSSPPWSISD
jgi:hypothetical protein